MRERHFVKSEPGKSVDKVCFADCHHPGKKSKPSRITFYPIMCLLLQISPIKMSFRGDRIGLV